MHTYSATIKNTRSKWPGRHQLRDLAGNVSGKQAQRYRAQPMRANLFGSAIIGRRK